MDDKDQTEKLVTSAQGAILTWLTGVIATRWLAVLAAASTRRGGTFLGDGESSMLDDETTANATAVANAIGW
jgi:hypothetical protein